MAENNRVRAEAGQRLDSLLAEIPGYIKGLFTPEKYPQLLKVMAQFHNISFRNAVLIAAQCRKDRMFLAGRKTWERKYSRRIKSGEKGISIVLPAPSGNRQGQAAGRRDAGAAVIPRFRVIDLYDMSQTDGAALKFPAPELSAAGAGFQIFMDAVGAVSPKPLHFADIGDNTVGYTYNADGGIVIQDGMDDVVTMKIAVKAVVRAVYHELENVEASGYWKGRAAGEMEINSAIFMTCHYFGLETSDLVFPNVVAWRSGMDMDGLCSCMDAVRRLASGVIYGVTGEMQKLQNMRETGRGMDRGEDAQRSAAEQEKDADGGTDRGAMTGAYKIADRMILVEPPGEGRMYYTYDSSYNMIGGGLLEQGLTAWQAAQRVARHLKGRIYDRNTKQYGRIYEQGHVSSRSRLVEMDADAFRNALKAAEMEADAHKVTQRTFGLKVDGYKGRRHAVERREVGGEAFYLMEHDTHWDSTANIIVSADGALAAKNMGNVFDDAALAVVQGYLADGTVRSGRDIRQPEFKEHAGTDMESRNPPPVSGMTEPEPAFHNYSRAEIEEMVYSYAKAAVVDSGLSGEVEVIAARVYGSRCREGLYTEQSDIDVVVSYSGGIREDDFFNMLNGEGFQIDGIPVDMNPVSVERTGTLEEYMERASHYLDQKESQMKTAGNTAQREAQEEKISFYVAECMEFPVMGEFYENLTLAGAVDQYHKIPAGRMDAEKGIGFQIEDGAGVHRGALLVGTEIQRESISMDSHFKDSRLVMQAVSELEETFAARGQRENSAQSENGMETQEKVARQEMRDAGGNAHTVPTVRDGAQQDRLIKNAVHNEKPEKDAPGGTGRKQSVLQAIRERQGAQKKETRTHRKGEQEL